MVDDDASLINMLL